MRVFIPTIEEWAACQLKEDNVEEFKKFIEQNCNGYDFHTYLVDNKLEYVTFKWNPFGYDYADTVTIAINKIFMYQKEDEGTWRVINNFKEDWAII